MIEFRDSVAKRLGLRLIVHTNRQALEEGINPFTSGSLYTDLIKTEALRQALNEGQFDAAIGGARRDEEKSRAKERVFSVRINHRWDPKSQRPELWHLFNTKLSAGQTMRVFPLSNWTELDVWRYVAWQDIEVVPLYFSKPRKVVRRSGTFIMIDDDRMPVAENERPEVK